MTWTRSLLAVVTFGFITVAVDVAILKTRTSLFDGPPSPSSAAAAASPRGGSGTSSSADQGGHRDDDAAGWGTLGSRRLQAPQISQQQQQQQQQRQQQQQQQRGSLLKNVVLMKPNYTLPACAVARREGPFRPELEYGGVAPALSVVPGFGSSAGDPPPRRPARVLVMGMQSSGASTFLFLLAQIPGSVAVVDLWVGRPAPRPEDLGLSDQVTCVLLKATVSTAVDVKAYIAAFRPDAAVLFLRHPAHNLKSLSTKFYKDTAGSPGQKFIALEDAFVRRGALFQLTIACVAARRCGPLPPHL